jgi:hypothetical protein
MAMMILGVALLTAFGLPRSTVKKCAMQAIRASPMP